MFAFALAAWSLIMVFVASQDDDATDDQTGGASAAAAARVARSVTNPS
jgi:hypothetical protein